jgi:hypothetical protein
MPESAVWVAGAVVALLVGCAGASPPPAEQPEPTSSEETPPDIEPSSTSGAATGAGSEGAGSGGEEATGAAEPPPRKKKDDSVPDDYSLMHGDCVQLGKQFAALTRSDQVAALSPKLTAQQRSQTEERIEVVAEKLGEQYAQTCEKNVGKSVSPQALKCAFDARSVKAFDACLNAVAP